MPANPYIKYSNLAIQMAVTIGLFAWGGKKLDEKYQTKKPYFTTGLSLLGIFAALYLVIREVTKSNKHDKK